ncbi:hypothetical protein H0H93_012162, partial [Arthromyces matolae]
IAAGNTGIKRDYCQFNVDGIIIVGGVDQENRVWEHSTQGSRIDIWAQASHIMPYVTGELERRLQHEDTLIGGTSFAAPLISGILALMLDAYGPNFSPVELKAILLAEGFHGVIQNL